VYPKFVWALKNTGGIIKPLLKNKHGDQSKAEMYRGITLTPVISKLLESMLLSLYGSFLCSDHLQFGFKANSGCNDAMFTFLSRQPILINVIANSTVHF